MCGIAVCGNKQQAANRAALEQVRAVVANSEHAGDNRTTLSVLHDANGFVEMRPTLGVLGYS